MKTPWADKTGVARLVTIFATVLLVSLGLCGVNFAAVIRFIPFDGRGVQGPPTAHEVFINRLGTFLTVAGTVELIVMGVSLLSLLVLGLVWIMRKFLGGERK